MNIEELIKGRRTAQQFLNEPIDFQILRKAVELMAYAPNHKHTFPWGVYRLNAREKDVLADLLAQKKLKKVKEPTQAQVQAIKSNFTNIPEMLLLLQKKQEDEFTQKEDYASVACGVEILSLYLWQHEIACKWSTSSVIHTESFKSSTSIDWDHWMLEGVLFIGKAARIPKRPERPKVLINS